MKNNSQELIKRLCDTDYFFKDNFKIAWVTYKVNGHKETYMVDSSEYILRISKLHFDLFKTGISRSTINIILDTLTSKAIFTGKEEEIFLRIAEKGDAIYYDLTNNYFESIKISDNGWEVIKKNEVLFKRYNHHKAQCYPEKNGDIKRLFKYLNINSDNILLFIVYLISCFIPNIQHPSLILYGESGHGKSTFSTIIKNIIDPSELELLSMPKKEEDFFLCLDEHLYLPFDNISNIKESVSDNLCKVVTGIGLMKRKLYKNKETIAYTVKRCVLLNGIEMVASKEDILNRSIILEIVKNDNSKAKPLNELIKQFEMDKPYIIGAIFDTLSKAKSIYKKIDYNGDYRMAEFAKWGFAIAKALGKDGRNFLNSYDKNIKNQLDETINSNTFLSSILCFLEKQKNRKWIGRPSDLLEKLKRIAIEEGFDIHSCTMPKGSNVITKKLDAYKSILKKVGVDY